MASISQYFEQAQLSLAAYALNLQSGMFGNADVNYTSKLIFAGMSATQADNFASTYTVLAQSAPTTNDFQGTLFQNVQTGQKILAIRGTENFTGYLTDLVDVAILGGTFAQEQYASLNNFYQQLITQGKLSSNEKLNVTGHSLGGFLAQAFSVDHSVTVTQTYTYNAPGIGGAVAEVLNWLGVTNSNVAVSNIANLQALGLSATAGLGTLLGNVQEIFTEVQSNPLSNHKIGFLTDALAVYDLYSRVDGSLATATIGTLLKSSSALNATTLESAVLALGKVFLPAAPSITTDNRDSLYLALQSVRQAVNGLQGLGESYTVRLMGLNAGADAALARADIAVRYALKELQPFAVQGKGYDSQAQELALFDPATGIGNLSDAWLTDRAAMLAWMTKAKTDDTAFSGTQLYVDTTLNEVTDFTDVATGQSVLVRPQAIFPDTRHITFGADTNNVISGGNLSDRLYGMGGNDELRGLDDADYLEGGAGQDTLLGGAGNDILDGRDGAGGDVLDGGSGFDTYYADPGDTIRDADGQGKVILNGKPLTFATRNKGETAYHDAAGNTYLYSGGTLQINDPLVIENFINGNLGIYLDEKEDPNDPNRKPKIPGYDPGNASLVRRIDPLVLDLDGNGQIDAVGSGVSGIYFDFNGDGIAEKAGWIAAQDGILALDANANNVIDDLGELFGSNTQDGFAELRGHDSNADGKINALDSDFAKLKVWQDANQDGISQSGELKTLDELGITSIDLATTPANSPIADNLLTATGSFTRNGTPQLAADILLAVNFALTDSNPSRPLDLPPQLDGDVFNLPWLRGYGNVKSLPVAYQEDPTLRQAARDLIAQGRNGILQNFEGFMAKWTGLSAAHAAHGVTRTNLTLEDKAWMLENLTGQDVQKSAIETANFGMIDPGAGRIWNTQYIDTQFQSFVQQEALSFATQVDTKDWLKGANYSLNLDRFVATDAALLQTSLLTKLVSIDNEDDALYAAVVLARLKTDGIALEATVLKQAVGQSAYVSLFASALDFIGGNVQILPTPGTATIQGGLLAGSSGADVLVGGVGNNVLLGRGGNDRLTGQAGNDTLNGGSGNDTLQGGAGNDTYIFGNGYGQDIVKENDWTAGNVDTVQMKAGITPGDITVTRDAGNLNLSLNDGADRLTLQNWFYGSSYIERVSFADGTVWDVVELERHITVATGTEGPDVINGNDANTVTYGLGGNDMIYGYGGNDTLNGGSGNDTLDGGTGDDTLEVGTGNDYLQGGLGNDTYVFGNGSGQDIVIENIWEPGKVDSVQMAVGITPQGNRIKRGQALLGLGPV